MKLVAICGFQGSGKDTIADKLIKQGYVRVSFASILKDVLSIMFSWDREILEGLTKEARQKREIVDEWWSKKLNIPNFTPRYALQYIGTEVMRNHFHKDIWVLAMQRRLESLCDKKVVISDLRYENEIEMLRSLDAEIFYVVRVKPTWFDNAKNGDLNVIPKTLHQSEWDWIKCCNEMTCINNTSTIDDLHKTIENLILN